MKFTFRATVASLLIAGTAAALAGNVVVTSSRPASSSVSLDQKAVNACLNAFTARILPASNVQVRAIVPPDGTPIFKDETGSFMADYGRMEVTMTARSARNDDLLAKSSCTVSKHAQVLNLSINVTDPAKLAGLMFKDIRLAAISR